MGGSVTFASSSALRPAGRNAVFLDQLEVSGIGNCPQTFSVAGECMHRLPPLWYFGLCGQDAVFDTSLKGRSALPRPLNLL